MLYIIAKLLKCIPRDMWAMTRKQLKWCIAHRKERNNRNKWRRMMREVS